MKNLYTFDEHLNEASSAFKHAVQQALQAAGYNLKQSEVKVGAKKVRGMGTKITLNGEMIGFDDEIPKMIASFTKSIEEDPGKYGLKESVNEAKDKFKVIDTKTGETIEKGLPKQIAQKLAAKKKEWTSYPDREKSAIAKIAMSEESVNEDKAYKSATNNELALYVTILSNQKVAAKSRGKTEEVEYLEKDIEEVKRELQHRKVKDSSNEEDLDEMTTAGSGAAGAYSGPSMWAKNRRNWRLAAKPTWNGGSFVKFKDKCVKYNNKKWCSQGAIDKPIELVSTLMETAYKLSEETGKDIDHITQLITKKYSVPNEHVTDSVIELAKESGYDMFSGVGQTEFTKDIDGGTEHEISIDGVSGDINAMVHNIEDNTFSGKTFDTFEDAIEYLETI